MFAQPISGRYQRVLERLLRTEPHPYAFHHAAGTQIDFRGEGYYLGYSQPFMAVGQCRACRLRRVAVTPTLKSEAPISTQGVNGVW